MKKTLTKQYYVSDFSQNDEIAAGRVYPTKKDATAAELTRFSKEIRWAPMFGGEMSGKFIPIDPDWADAEVTLVVKIDKKNGKPEYVENTLKIPNQTEEVV
jgi:hypothetical protein